MCDNKEVSPEELYDEDLDAATSTSRSLEPADAILERDFEKLQGRSEVVTNSKATSTTDSVGQSKEEESDNVEYEDARSASIDENQQSDTEEAIKKNKHINILLLSETGVGKSTFINAVANYLYYKLIDRAENGPPLVPIPTKFRIEDKDGERREISLGGTEKKKYLKPGDSETQDVKSYLFSLGRTEPNINLIDTPGMGDTRGPAQDYKNCDYILNYLSNLKELHAICVLFRPTNTRNTVLFQYCITEILSRLDKSASKNIIFGFTNTRGSNYSPGDTYDVLQNNLDEIFNKNNVRIPFGKKNIFCFDNEAFKYIAAVHSKVEFTEKAKENYRGSWKHSVNQLWSMIRYVKELKPHLVQNTNAINEARRMIIHLTQPLADISEHIHDKIEAIERHERKLKDENLNLEQLKKEMMMPIIDLEVLKLDKPATICTAAKCSEIYKVGDKDKWHYKQRCHEPCFLKNVQGDAVNNAAIFDCEAIQYPSGICFECGCSYTVHMHVYYMTRTVERNIENVNKLKNIDDQEKLMAEVNNIIGDMTVRRDELQEEHNMIVKSCAKFTHFLQKNAITPFNDYYREYIEYLITREEAMGVLVCNKNTVKHLRNLLNTYTEAKKLFDDASKLTNEVDQVNFEITSKEIQATVQELYKLKHSGDKIREMYECQQKSRNVEHEYTLHVYRPLPSASRMQPPPNVSLALEAHDDQHIIAADDREDAAYVTKKIKKSTTPGDLK